MSRPESVQRAIDVTVRHTREEVEIRKRELSEQPFWRFMRRRAIRKDLADARQRQRDALEVFGDDK